MPDDDRKKTKEVEEAVDTEIDEDTAPRHAAHAAPHEASDSETETPASASSNAPDFNEDYYNDDVISRYALSGDSFHGSQDNVSLPPKNVDYDLGSYYDTAVDAETIQKSRKLKIILIIVLVILITVIGVLCYLGFTLIDNSHSENMRVASTSSSSTMQVDDTVDQIASLNIKFPSLNKLFGHSADEVVSLLGSDYQLVSTTQLTLPTNEDGTPIATDDNTAVQIAEIDYKIPANATSASTSVNNTPKIYLSLNSSGKVIECYATASLDVLGYPSSTFSKLVSNADVLNELLKDVEVTPAADYVYVAPDQGTYTTYMNDSSGNPTTTVAKEAYEFTGATSNVGVRPTTWSVSFDYDYTTANISGKKTDLVRTVKVKLS